MIQTNRILWALLLLLTASTSIVASSITMTSITATDDSGSVEYYFTCVSGGCNDSGWQASPTYIDSGLQPDTTYSYTVVARDAAGNMNIASAPASATTPALVAKIIYSGFENENIE